MAAPPTLVEFAAAVLLAFLRPPGVPAIVLWLGLGLVCVVWLSTAFLQVPRHATLSLGFGSGALTVARSMRWAVTLWMAAKILH